MSTPDDSKRAPSRRREVAGGAIAALVMLAVVVLGLVLRGGDEGGGDVAAAGTATSSPAATSGAGEAPPTTPAEEAAPATADEAAPGDAAELPRSLPAVAFDEEASGEDGVRGQVVSLEAIDGTAEGVGNVAGPALRATVRLTNGAAEPVDLDLVSVTLTHGADAVPASPLDDPSRAPLGGTLEPGESAEGVYVFTVPEGDRDVVSLTVGYGSGVPFLVFTGPAD
jgi:cell division septation protein DedD